MRKSHIRIPKSVAVAIPGLLLTLIALTGATYAWFTSNNRVETDRVTARTADENLELQISETGGADFRPVEAARLIQLNDTEATGLLPVSTADLSTFVYNPVSLEGTETNFTVLSEENFYYHGRIYMRVVAEGQEQGSVALYLDDTDQTAKLLNPDADNGLIMNAARLGLRVGSQAPVILRLSDGGNAPEQQIRNTYLNGALLEDGMVLSGADSAAPDPSIRLEDCTIRITDGVASAPSQSIARLAVNQIYAMDIYFYLEGCDPDCSDSVSYSGLDLRLAFYGQPEEAS